MAEQRLRVSAMRAAKRDQNERKMVEAWRACGALWVPMGPDAGFDGVLIFQGCAHIVEIKQVSGPKRYTLTQNELHTCLEMERRGVTYHIVCNMTEALALVGAD